ncbi:MAG: efflux RND transporter periplasmic adaptor subunit [Lachnospiraceae bacterium]|nr:efflux RND transporter periplasmic adaptor subunit [Lachnospiraceae bacterium]
MEENKKLEQPAEFPEIDLKIDDKTKKKKKIKPWIIFTILASVVIVVLAIVMVAKMSEAMMGMGTPVEVTEALKGSIAQTVETSGTVSSEETKTYFADVTAKIDALEVSQGQYVKRGDVLLTYNTEELEKMMEKAELETKISTYGADAAITGINHAQQKAAEAAVNYEDAKKYVAHYKECVGTIKAQLKEANDLATKQAEFAAQMEKLGKALKSNPDDKASAKALKKAEKEYNDVTKKLKKYDMGALKEALEICSGDLAAYEALEKEYELAKESDPAASLNKAQQVAMKESAQLVKGDAEEQLAMAREGVKADFNGIVSEVAAVEGQTVAEGIQLFTIHNAEKVKVTLSVTKYDMKKLAEGQTAVVEINDREYAGSVSNISHIATTNASGASVVSVDIHIENPDEYIILGMEAKVSVQTAEENDILVIPSASVNYSSDGIFCYVLADGIIEKREIETGISDDEYIQILSGLSEGDKVVTNVTGMIEEGMPATEMPAASAENDADKTEE